MTSMTALPIRRPEAPVGPTTGDHVRTVVRGIGELFITLGALLLLLCVYQLWWTNVESAAATSVERDQIVQQWAKGPAVVLPLATGATKPVAKPAYGSGFALLYIPRLKDKVWGLPIIEGVGLDVLAKGAGHYPEAAMPGQVGNFAIAAHRATHNEPFRNIDDLRVGDKVYVQTRTAWFTYVLNRTKIVKPTARWVIQPVPGRPNATPTEKLITLTTCNPRWASYERFIWWGTMSATQPASAGAPDGITGTA